jgi:hypothetical protein
MEATTTPSRFARALHDLLHAAEGMTVERWALWLNPWYAKLGPDGKPTPSYTIPMGPGGDIFDDPPTEEEIAAYKENLAKNWVPCHTIGHGVTVAQIQRWLNDEEMPSMDHLGAIIGYFEHLARTPAEQAALDRFDDMLRSAPHAVTPFYQQFRQLRAPATCIAAHLFFSRFGIIGAMHRLPMARWDEFFKTAVAHFERPR